MNRNDIFEWTQKQFGTTPEYLWSSAPNYAVLRNNKNKKWYALIMDIPKNKLGLDDNEIIDIINIKCGAILVNSLLQENGFFSAYHMNKENWISIVLDNTVSDEKIKNYIGLSYELTSK